MKKISTEKLDELLYIDRAKTKKIKINAEDQDSATVRSYLRWAIDQQVKLDRPTLAIVNTIFNDLKEGDLKLETPEFNWLKSHIDTFIGTQGVTVYQTCIDLIDSAEDYKP